MDFDTAQKSGLDRENLNSLVTRGDFESAGRLLSRTPAPDAAEFLLTLDAPRLIMLLRRLDRDTAAEVFSYLDSRQKDLLLASLTDEEVRRFLTDMEPDDRVDFLHHLPGQAIQRLINLLGPSERRETLEILGFPEESVGRLLTPRYVAVRPDWTIQRAIEQIRLKGADSETVNSIYVTDGRWKLLDSIELREIILAGPEQRIEDIMDYSVISITALRDREEAVELVSRYDLEVLPVTDDSGVLLGIVTFDDLFDVAQDEFTEDFHQAGAVLPLKTSYSEAGVWMLYKRRVLWLMMLLGINIISSGVVGANEELIGSFITLAFFIPLLIASGGNTGAQSATLIIRALSTGDIKPGEWFRALMKELRVGVLLGATLGAVSSFLGLFRGGLEIAIVISLAMAFIIVFSNIIGAALPLVLMRLGQDPAVSSSPLITSLADILGLLIYFAIASALL